MDRVNLEEKPASFSRNIPAALVAFRAIAGPALIAAEAMGGSGTILAGIVVLAFLSDVFDGVLARYLGVATEELRRADSIVDTAFYIAASIALLLRVPAVLIANATGIGMILGLELARQVLERLKFGRMAAYHMWSAKLWGITLLLGFCEAFVTGAPGPLFRAAVIMGVIADLEGLAASLVLSKWQHDIPTIWHAAMIERQHR